MPPFQESRVAALTNFGGSPVFMLHCLCRRTKFGMFLGQQRHCVCTNVLHGCH